jgi:hypothetical protein
MGSAVGLRCHEHETPCPGLKLVAAITRDGHVFAPLERDSPIPAKMNSTSWGMVSDAAVIDDNHGPGASALSHDHELTQAEQERDRTGVCASDHRLCGAAFRAC